MDKINKRKELLLLEKRYLEKENEYLNTIHNLQKQLAALQSFAPLQDKDGDVSCYHQLKHIYDSYSQDWEEGDSAKTCMTLFEAEQGILPIEDNTEKAAENYAKQPYYSNGHTLSVAPQLYLKRGFIAGAQWQKLQPVSAPLDKEQDKIKEAIEWCDEQIKYWDKQKTNNPPLKSYYDGKANGINDVRLHLQSSVPLQEPKSLIDEHCIRYLKVEHDFQVIQLDGLGISREQFFEQRINAVIAMAWKGKQSSAPLQDDREKIVNECRDALLKQMFTMTHTNGYPSEAVPKATILSLPALMQVSSAPLQEMPEREYNDNRVYRTNERQLATRIDGLVVRREATLIIF